MLWRKTPRDIAKVGVEGSNPFARSRLSKIIKGIWEGHEGGFFRFGRGQHLVNTAVGRRRGGSGLPCRGSELRIDARQGGCLTIMPHALGSAPGKQDPSRMPASCSH